MILSRVWGWFIQFFTLKLGDSTPTFEHTLIDSETWKPFLSMGLNIIQYYQFDIYLYMSQQPQKRQKLVKSHQNSDMKRRDHLKKKTKTTQNPSPSSCGHCKPLVHIPTKLNLHLRHRADRFKKEGSIMKDQCFAYDVAPLLNII